MKDRISLAMTQSFHRQIRMSRRLTRQDQERCVSAACRFIEDPAAPGLNFEKLGGGPRSNLWSIRASRELRILLTVGEDRCIFVNAGHHDAMYDWANRRQHHVDLDSETLAEINVTIAGTPLSLRRSPSVSGTVAAVRHADEHEHGQHAHLPPESTQASIETVGIQELIQRVFRGDFEEWQLFLHPDQKPLASRHWSGAARIRGAAGTGKTVIGLHRLAELARRYPKEQMLFTTYSRSLSDLLEMRYRNLPMAPSNVEFLNIDRVAYKYNKGNWANFSLVNQAFDAACNEIIVDSPLERIGRDYLREEIERVIKGNGLRSLEDYMSVERLGRKRSFNQSIRKLVWELSDLWTRKLTQQNVVSYPERKIRARDAVQNLPRAPYRCVVVDEAQDMTLVEMQLVRALVAGAPKNTIPDDGILILDDPAQRIYAGGYRLRWAELDIAGRAHLLKRNYRNVPAVIRAAKRVRGNVLVTLESEDDRSILDAELDFPESENERPILALVNSKGEIPYLREKLREFHATANYRPNEMAVFLKHNQQVDATINSLKRGGIPCAQLTRDGFSGSGVRVGTYDRARGLEFRAVFLPRLGISQFPHGNDDTAGRQPDIDANQHLESRLLELDRLYIAMTRARELLFLIADEEPCDEIRRALGEEIVLRDFRGQPTGASTPVL